MKKNVLLLESIATEADILLKNKTDVYEAFHGLNPLEIANKTTIHAVVTRGKGQVNYELINACPQLEVIARCGVGLDNVDIDEATKRNIKVINAPGSNSSTIAEHTITLILMCVRNVWNSVERVKTGDWNWRNQYNGDEIRGKTLGILGLGNIGKRVAKLAEVFGMKVIYWDKVQTASAYNFYPIDEVLKMADVVTIHVPLLKETENLIGEKKINLMKPQAYLINTARGPIIDEKALLKALDNSKIAGFASDVLAVEPPEADHPLIKHPKTLITPHTGSLTATTYRNMCVITVENVIAILNGSQPDMQSVFNRDELT